MAMTSVMDEINYERKNFNVDPRDQHPLCITEKHFQYHLYKDEQGNLSCVKDERGKSIRSPRRLTEMTIWHLVQNPQILEKTDGQFFPTNTYPKMLSEAIFLREARAIEWVVSTWPMYFLRVLDVIPVEDYLETDYMTMPLEGNDNMCLVDCFILGLLKLKPESNLKYVDFSWFEKDRKLCKELCRLPILWMKPENRTVEQIHSQMSDSLEVTKDKVQRFLNRISVVYSNIDGEFKHGNEISPIVINLDLKITIDDVPLGLSLQRQTPFKFTCHRLWMKHVPEVGLTPGNLGRLLDTSRITHFEFEDPLLPQDETKFASLLGALEELHNLTAIGLPNSIDVTVDQEMTRSMNRVLKKLRHLRRLDFSYCNLQGQLQMLLDGLSQRIIYLSLKDCRLMEEDFFFLVHWRPVSNLREVNLSCNNLKHLDQVVVALLQKMSRITCLSVSFCQLSIHSQVVLSQECKECSHLKVLNMQGYTPLPQNDVLEILHICTQIRSMQKIVLFPEVYAFPGNNDLEREASKYLIMQESYDYLERRGREDIELE